MLKRPVSINLSKKVLEQIDKAAQAENRKRSAWVELHFTNLFFPPQPEETEAAIKLG